MQLFVIEGLDYVGKSTQLKLVSEKLKKKLGNDNVSSVHFPDYTSPVGDTIAKYLKNEPNATRGFHDMGQADPRLVANNYILDRAVFFAEPANHYPVMILDRFSTSTAAYQGAMIDDEKLRNEAIADWEYVEHIMLRIPTAEVIVKLEATPAVRKQLLALRNEDLDVLESMEDSLSIRDEILDSVSLNRAKYFYKVNVGDENDNLRKPEDIADEIIELFDTNKFIAEPWNEAWQYRKNSIVSFEGKNYICTESMSQANVKPTNVQIGKWKECVFFNGIIIVK